MLVPLFSIQLETSVAPRMMACGAFNGRNSALAIGTDTGRVLLYDSREARLSPLNISQKVTCLVAGSRDGDAADVL